MSPLIAKSDWNFRIQNKRLVVAKTINESIRKVAVLDVLTNLMFTIQVPQKISLGQLIAGHQYVLDLKVYTSKNIEDIENDFTSFFEALDIDQNMDDFIKAYWLYPKKICFELEEVEEL